MLEKGSQVIVREGRHKGEVGTVEYCHYGPDATSIYVRFPDHNDSVLFSDWSLLEEYPAPKKQQKSVRRLEKSPSTAFPAGAKTAIPEQAFDPVSTPGGPVTSSGEALTVGRNYELLSIKVLLDVAEVSALTGLGQTFLLRAIKAGILKGTKVDGEWRVKRSDLDAYVKKL
jgi:excisionase family DNA binding protein